MNGSGKRLDCSTGGFPLSKIVGTAYQVLYDRGNNEGAIKC